MPCHRSFRCDRRPGCAWALRAFLYARLNVDLPGHRTKLPPASVRQAFNRARRFFEFVRVQIGMVDLGRVDRSLLDAGMSKSSRPSGGGAPIVVAQVLEMVVDLYAYRDHLPIGGLRFEPWPGRSPSLVAGCRFGRGRTARHASPRRSSRRSWRGRCATLPIFAPDILAARAEMTRLAAHRDAAARGRGRPQRPRASWAPARTPRCLLGCSAAPMAEACRSGRPRTTASFAGIRAPAP